MQCGREKKIKINKEDEKTGKEFKKNASHCMNHSHEDLLVYKDGAVAISRLRNLTTELCRHKDTQSLQYLT